MIVLTAMLIHLSGQTARAAFGFSDLRVVNILRRMHGMRELTASDANVIY